MPHLIPNLPPHLRTVPNDRHAWFVWREQLLAFRTWAHRKAAEDLEFRAGLVTYASESPAFFMAVFGAIIEPRTMRDFTVAPDGSLVEFYRPKGWYPWVPYGFQVGLLDTIQETLDTTMSLTGKEDLFVEKSRDMGATWVFCFRAGWDWLFGEDVLVGMLSHKEDLVDSDNPNSMFYKVKSVVGVNRKVPELCYAPETIFHGVPVRIPDYLVPGGFDPKHHDRKLNLIHPTKSNQIFGESTTSKSMIGMRTWYNVLDEVSKIRGFLDIYSGQSAVTDHRLCLTSPDRRESDDAYLLAEQARMSLRDPAVEGPRLVSLPWNVHPLRDVEWYEKTLARHGADEQGFAREYEIDWNAGLGDWVYPIAKSLLPEDAPYRPGLGEVYCTIDPGLRDPTAVIWLQWIPGEEKPWRVIESLVLRTPNAEYLAPILMGYPRGHEQRALYPDHTIQEVMDFTWELHRTGTPVSYVGDPYGDNVGGANSDTFYTALWMRADDLNREVLAVPDPEGGKAILVPPHEIMVMTKYDEGARFHQARKEALTRKLPFLAFHNSARVRYVLSAVQNNRYKNQDEHRLVLNEPQKPAHDWCSHPSSALEYWAVISTITELDTGAPPPPHTPHAPVASQRQPTPGYVPQARR